MRASIEKTTRKIITAFKSRVIQRKEPINTIYIYTYKTQIQKKPALTINGSNHDEKVSKNFWSYCKNTFEKDNKIKSDFDKSSCKNCFKNPYNKKVYYHLILFQTG